MQLAELFFAHWSATALTRGFARFFAEACGWEGEHALAVALLAVEEALEGFGEEGEEGEGEAEGDGDGGGGGGEAAAE